MGLKMEEEESSVILQFGDSSRWVDGTAVSFEPPSVFEDEFTASEEDEEELEQEDERGEEEEEERLRSSSSTSSLKKRLIKKSKRLDSLDVEAMAIAASNAHHFKETSPWSTVCLAFQTLGVVYGDMGTSPLYVFSDVFSKVPIESEVDVLGALSLVMYTIALIPLAKYVFIVLKANDNGEGGTFALYSLISRYADVNMLPNKQAADELISSYRLQLPTPELQRALRIKETLEKNSLAKTLLLLLVLMGTSLIIGDGILTPAMSVMSAVSGLQGEIKNFNENDVVVVSIMILVGLFSIQRFGTSKVGVTFAPALALWFFCLASVGIYNLSKYGINVLRALNPVYIYMFFNKNNRKAWSALGGCVLCITGAEAMFADLGHFSVPSIQIAFTCVVFPCLLLAYLGQAAYLLKYPHKAERVFYDSLPDGMFWPVFGIATVAAVIASQAMISATFSCIKQAMALGSFPRLKIVHTSRKLMGQIYVPVINWFLMIMCVAVVATFRNTTDIANAYGIAEVGVMLVSTALVTLVMLLIWQVRLLYATLFGICFGAIEMVYLSSVLSKILEGGWVPLAFASCFLGVMYVWNYGSRLKYGSEVRDKMSMDLMVELGHELGTVRVPGMGLLYNDLVNGIPSVLGQFLVSLPAIHSTIVFVCIKHVALPVVPREERFLFRRVCPKKYRMFRCVARYGYKDDVRSEDHVAFQQLLAHSLEGFLMKEEEDREEILGLREAVDCGFTYLMADGDVRARKESWFVKKLVVNYMYAFLRRNCRAGAALITLPHVNIIQVGMTYMV